MSVTRKAPFFLEIYEIFGKFQRILMDGLFHFPIKICIWSLGAPGGRRGARLRPPRHRGVAGPGRAGPPRWQG